MITLRPSSERLHGRRPTLARWLTFFPQGRGAARLEILGEGRVPPGGKVLRPSHGHAEVITYVRAGALRFEDSAGRSGVVHAGEFQRLATGPGLRHSDRNASRSRWAHIFQIRIGSAAPTADRASEQKHFSAAERRGRLCLVASADGRGRSLCTYVDALVYSAMLEVGHHVAIELAPRRSAWLQIVEGQVTLDDLVLTTGDGAEVTAERVVSFTAREASELLLVDLGGAR